MGETTPDTENDKDLVCGVLPPLLYSMALRMCGGGGGGGGLMAICPLIRLFLFVMLQYMPQTSIFPLQSHHDLAKSG